MTTFQSAKPKAKQGLKIAGKLVLFVALRYGPAGVAGWAVKSVARRPLKMLLAFTIEPFAVSHVASSFRTPGREKSEIVSPPS